MDDQPSRPGAADLAILAYVGALLVVWSPALYLGLLTPRIAVLLVGLGPGLVVVAGLVRQRDHAARWAAAYLAWAALSVAVAHHPRRALAGTFGTDNGWIYLAGYVGAWGLGRRLGPAGRRVLPVVVLLGVGLNALMGIVEAAVEPVGDLATESGRVHGLVSNSLFLGGLLVGALALTGSLTGRHPERRLVLVAGVIPLAMAANLTGSRAALVGGAVVAGFVFSLPLQNAESGATRLGETSTSSGYQSRAIMWRLGVEATADRPLIGWGPGRFSEATAPRTTAEFVLAEGPDKLFYDAHNIVVEHLVTTGVVGLALLVGFAVSVARRSRGPLAWFGGGIALTWLFNPVSVSTGAVALLALGASWVGRPSVGPPADAATDGGTEVEPGPESETDGATAAADWRIVAARTVGAVLAAAGLVAGVTLVRADALLDGGVATGDVATLQRAQDLLPPDAVVTGTLADALARQADLLPSEANHRAVVAASQRAVDLDPTRSHWWVRLGASEFAYGVHPKGERLDRAEAAFRRALELSPWSVEAMFGLRGVAEERGDQAEVDRLTDRLCEVDVCLPPGR